MSRSAWADQRSRERCDLEQCVRVASLPAHASAQFCLVDPERTLIGMHLYEGEFKVIAMDAKGLLDKEAVSIRLDELQVRHCLCFTSSWMCPSHLFVYQVLDMAFLHGLTVPTLAVLYHDTKGERHVKTYEVSVQEKDFGSSPWFHNNLDAGASLLIPIPSVRGGVIVVGEQSILFTNGVYRLECCSIINT